MIVDEGSFVVHTGKMGKRDGLDMGVMLLSLSSSYYFIGIPNSKLEYDGGISISLAWNVGIEDTK